MKLSIYWYRLYFGAWELFGYEQCEDCELMVKEVVHGGLCQACYEYRYCECGRELSEEYGSSPGDGLCRRCD